MKERPILFSAPMVRAILDGRKTVTRRAVKNQPTLESDEWVLDAGGTGKWMASGPSPATGGTRQTWGWAPCPYGQPGDRLWVRETFAVYGDQKMCAIHYRADRPHHVGMKGMGYKPSIHMPRWVSRILLEITDVHVERLHDISEEQALAEGIVGVAFRPDDGWPICTGYMVGPDDGKTGLQTTAAKAFAGLWDSVGGDWDGNPWVWVVEFKRVTP
ncbi:hypothetical protein ABH909_005607 [Pseudomonas sp. BS3782 TE3695]|uniref:hypothetical protein n=1 Tax=Pseudomonas sp. BS3782 TE3695 TaxID=3349323 RepID=UPI003D2309E9